MGDQLRYEPIVKIASGGMATVHLGTLRGELGFRQLVAIKRPHPHLLEDASFRRTLLTEARLAASIHHANVVAVRDIETVGDSVQLVMDYVAGASLGDLIAAWSNGGAPLGASVAVRVVLDACAGLHAAHELADDAGRSLGLVHRDVSPQNILVGLDGVARVADFGIAKSTEASGAPTTEGALKGKVGYMAPEYVRGGEIDRRADVFALGVVLWEALAGKRLFKGANEGDTLERVLTMAVPPISQAASGLDAALDDVVARALARDRDTRFATAEAFGTALEVAARKAGLVASPSDVGRHVRAVAGEAIEARARAARDRLGAVAATVETAANAATRVDVPRPAASAPRTSRRALAIGLAAVAVVAGATAVTLGVLASRTAPVTTDGATTPASGVTSSAAVATSTTSAPPPSAERTTPAASSTAAAGASPRPRAPTPPHASSTPKPTWPPPNPYPH